jgi:hypothetical protein
MMFPQKSGKPAAALFPVNPLLKAQGLAGTLQIENSSNSCLRNMSVVPSFAVSLSGISISIIRNPFEFQSRGDFSLFVISCAGGD